jgi:hypothetical protein
MPNAILPPLPVIPNVEVRHIPGWPGYAVSDDGRVFSSKHHKQWKQLRTHLSGNRTRYETVILSQRITRENKLVHHLVLETFLGPCPVDMEACHNNGCTSDNTIHNLRWDLPINNSKDKIAHGTVMNGEKNPATKISDQDVALIRTLRKQGMITRHLVEKFHISRSQVQRIMYNKSRL